MRMSNKRIEEILREISLKEKELSPLYKELENEKKKFLDEKISEGWKKFRFSSEYFGSHREYTDDEEENYLFHSSIDISRWEGIHFTHGTWSGDENYEAFKEWIVSLGEELYIEL